MVALRLPVFGGMIPSLDKHLLSEKNAAYSENTWLYSGALAGLPKDIKLHTLVNPNAVAVFRIPARMDDPTYMYNSDWMEFENSDTSFLSAPVAADEHKRFYWASKTEQPKYNTLQRIRDGLPPYILGLPEGPDVTVTVSGGSSTTMVSRAYLATVVSQFGEEGPAGGPFLVNGKLDDTFGVTVGGVSASDMGGNRVVTHIRVYRTITSNQGTTTYYLVRELAARTAPQTFSDNMTDANLASRTILESTAWTAPPWLDGFVAMPNGIIAGWKGNELWFSEAYRPHAWPAGYSLTLEYDIVGMGVINQTLVVCTKGAPYTASGVNPASITTAKLSSFEPCLSQGSIISSEQGVFYTSPNGLVVVNPGIAENLTRQVVSRDKWHELANQAKVRAARIGSAYYAYGAGVSRVFQEEKPEAFQENMIQTMNEEGLNAGFLIDASNENATISMLNAERYVRNLQNDPWSGEVLSIIDGGVYWLNQDPNYQMRPYKWRSKVFHLPVAKNFSAFKLYYQQGDETNPNPNFDVNQSFDPDVQDVLVRVFANGKLVAAREVNKSGQLHRLPTGFIAEFWEVEFESRRRINNFQMATSVKELSLA